jgi:hypothetical protein
MPYREPEPDDPHLLVGVTLPADAGATREMVTVVAGEFAQLGFDRRRILSLFESPYYAAVHAAWRELGEAEVTRLVDEAVAVYGSQRLAVRDGSGG